MAYSADDRSGAEGRRAGDLGWGGLPPSIVQVPVVVIEGESGTGRWRELPFRYTPFGEKRAPRRTAPHQPRLDWQMWFAALGSYQHNPWLLHLMYKILVGGGNSSAALTLLDLDAYPFRKAPPARVRATLYHYDFTRVASPWATRQKAQSILPSNCSIAGPFAGGNGCERWWSRTRVSEYLPPLDRAMLEEQVVKQQGWPVGKAARGQANDDPCRRSLQAQINNFISSALEEAELKPPTPMLPLAVCDAVVALRISVGAPLRRFVGFHSLGGAFVDGPMIIIVAAVTAAALVGFMLRLAGWLCLHARYK